MAHRVFLIGFLHEFKESERSKIDKADCLRKIFTLGKKPKHSFKIGFFLAFAISLVH